MGGGHGKSGQANQGTTVGANPRACPVVRVDGIGEPLDLKMFLNICRGARRDPAVVHKTRPRRRSCAFTQFTMGLSARGKHPGSDMQSFAEKLPACSPSRCDPGGFARYLGVFWNENRELPGYFDMSTSSPGVSSAGPDLKTPD